MYGHQSTPSLWWWRRKQDVSVSSVHNRSLMLTPYLIQFIYIAPNYNSYLKALYIVRSRPYNDTKKTEKNPTITSLPMSETLIYVLEKLSWMGNEVWVLDDSMSTEMWKDSANEISGRQEFSRREAPLFWLSFFVLMCLFVCVQATGQITISLLFCVHLDWEHCCYL